MRARRWRGSIAMTVSSGHFIGGAYTRPGKGFDSRNPATTEVLARVTQGTRKDVDTAVAAARKAQPKWAALPGHERAKVLYALARLLQKHSRLFAVLESLDNGKPIRETPRRRRRARDPALSTTTPAGPSSPTRETGRRPAALGVIGQVIPWNFPLLMLAWKIAPALAMGNYVVLKPADVHVALRACSSRRSVSRGRRPARRRQHRHRRRPTRAGTSWTTPASTRSPSPARPPVGRAIRESDGRARASP